MRLRYLHGPIVIQYNIRQDVRDKLTGAAMNPDIRNFHNIPVHKYLISWLCRHCFFAHRCAFFTVGIHSAAAFGSPLFILQDEPVAWLRSCAPGEGELFA
jgi:hypothetical protein